jgi:hypothetical protein
MGGVLAYFLIPGVSESVDPLVRQVASNTNPSTEPLPANPSPDATNLGDPTASPTAISSLEQGAIIQVISSTPTNAQRQSVPLLLRRGWLPQNQTPLGVVPGGSILQVINKSPDQQQNSWVELKVCSSGMSHSQAQIPQAAKSTAERPKSQAGKSPGGANPQQAPVPYVPVKQGQIGWLKEADVLPHLNPNFTPTNECASPSVSPPTLTPTPRAIQSP